MFIWAVIGHSYLFGFVLELDRIDKKVIEIYFGSATNIRKAKSDKWWNTSFLHFLKIVKFTGLPNV